MAAPRTSPGFAGLVMLVAALGAASCAQIIDVDGDYEEVDGGAGGQGGDTGEGGGGTGTAGGGTGAAGGGSGATGGGSACHAAPNSCAEAEDLGAVNGDQGNMTITAKGTTSKWMSLYLAEISTSSITMSYRATLESPAGLDWDLHIYTGSLTGTDCSAMPATATGDPETFYGAWNDVHGEDDSRFVVFEVRWASGEICGDAAEWTLSIQGNAGN